MQTFVVYFITGIGTLLPVLWLMLGAWMGVPIIWSECVAGVGSCLLVVAAYLSLFDRRSGAVFAAAGLLCSVPFWVVEPVKGVRQDGRPIFWVILLTYLLLAGFCAVRLRRDFGLIGRAGVGRRGRRAIVSVSVVLFVCLIAAGQWQWMRNQRPPCRYVIPDGYVGWVVIHFERPGAPPIALKEKELLFEIPESGVLYTSSKQEFGVARDRYFYKLAGGGLRELADAGWGKGGMIWNASSGTQERPGAPDDHTEQFFIGTEEQEKAMENLPNTGGGIEPGDLRSKLR